MMTVLAHVVGQRTEQSFLASNDADDAASNVASDDAAAVDSNDAVADGRHQGIERNNSMHQSARTGTMRRVGRRVAR